MKNNSSMNKFLKINIFNIIFLSLSIIIGFFSPLILSINDYAEYRLFILYIGFFGIFTFGVHDGLINNINNDNDSELVASSITIQIIVSVLLAFLIIITNVLDQYIYIIFSIPFISTVIIILRINILKLNIRKYSIYMLIPKIWVLLFLFFYFFIDLNINYFFILYIFLNLMIILFEIIYYRSYFKNFSLLKSFKKYIFLSRTGFSITLNYFIYFFAINLDKFYIEFNNSISEYAYYSFSYSLILIIINLTKGTESIIIPIIKKDKNQNKIEFIKKLMEVLSIFLMICSYSLIFIRILIQSLFKEYTVSSGIFILMFLSLIPYLIFNLIIKQDFILEKRNDLLYHYNISLLILNLILIGIFYILKIEYMYISSTIFIGSSLVNIYFLRREFKYILRDYLMLNFFMILLVLSSYINILIVTIIFFIINTIFISIKLKKIIIKLGEKNDKKNISKNI